MPGRQGADNVVIAQEVFHAMKSKKGRQWFMAIKEDLEKVYDRLNWQFLMDTLRDVGFEEHFCKWILACGSSLGHY